MRWKIRLSGNKEMLFLRLWILMIEKNYRIPILVIIQKSLMFSHGNRSINAWWRSKTIILLEIELNANISFHAALNAGSHAAAARSPRVSWTNQKTLSKLMTLRWLSDQHCSTRSTQGWRFLNQRDNRLMILTLFLGMESMLTSILYTISWFVWLFAPLHSCLQSLSMLTTTLIN